MNWKYYCPYCRAHLNPSEDHVILLADSKYGKGIFVFDHEPGNYDLILPEGIEVEKGQHWDFYCPVCNKNLQSEENENIAKVHMKDPQGSDHMVMFSRIAGEQSTFLVRGDGVKEYGADCINYAAVLWNKYFLTH